MSCARCDQLEAQVAELRDALLGAQGVDKLRTMGFTQAETTMLRMLINNPMCTRKALAAVLYPALRPSSADQSMVEMISRMRRKMADKFRIAILTVYGLGWRLEQSDQERLREMLKQEPR
jgi:DNA-binding response OmpR family regulator